MCCWKSEITSVAKCREVILTFNSSYRINWQYKKTKRETEVSQRLINFVLHMYVQLTSEQRYQIFALLQTKTPRKIIAKIIGKSESTISRELRRNSTDKGGYLPWHAHDKALARRKRTASNSAKDPVLMWRVRQLLIDEQWSPRQISGALAREGVQISHETIYRMIRADDTGELARHTRHKMKHHRRPKNKPMPIAHRTSIHERPLEANGKRFGDWEMDLVVDKAQHAILTLVERQTNMILMAKLPHGKKAKYVAQTVNRLLFPYRESILTITTDNGPEFAAHLDITKELGVTVFFTDPYSAWQKGAIENTNKLIRQYIPKMTDFNKVTDSFVMAVQKKLNRRPREKLNFSTPKKEFFKHFI